VCRGHGVASGDDTCSTVHNACGRRECREIWETLARELHTLVCPRSLTIDDTPQRQLSCERRAIHFIQLATKAEGCQVAERLRCGAMRSTDKPRILVHPLRLTANRRRHIRAHPISIPRNVRIHSRVSCTATSDPPANNASNLQCRVYHY